MRTLRLTHSAAIVLLFGLTACPNKHPAQPADTGPVTDQPAAQAISTSVSPTGGRFCCDPFKPFPQKVGTMEFHNTNTKADADPIYFYLNLGDAASPFVGASDHVFSLKNGERKTVDIFATSCGFESTTVPVEWGYTILQPNITQTLTVNNACPSQSDLLIALRILCEPQLIDPLFYPTFVVAAVAVLVQHTSIRIPAILITLMYTEIFGHGGFRVFLDALKLAAVFSLVNDNVAFPPGQGPNGYTLYPNLPTQMAEGEYLVVYQALLEDIPLNDTVQHFQYGFVFDADNDESNNYQPSNPEFANDFFKNTDRWYVAGYDPTNGWKLTVQSARDGNIQEVPSSARIIIAGDSMILVAPASEFDVPTPKYRVTSFTHKGDWGLQAPHDWSGDPTPPVDEPLAEIK